MLRIAHVRQVLGAHCASGNHSAFDGLIASDVVESGPVGARRAGEGARLITRTSSRALEDRFVLTLGWAPTAVVSVDLACYHFKSVHRNGGVMATSTPRWPDLKTCYALDDGAVAMTHAVTITEYQSYRNLPTLAGIATIAEAARPGLSVEACVGRLKRVALCFQATP